MRPRNAHAVTVIATTAGDAPAEARQLGPFDGIDLGEMLGFEIGLEKREAAEPAAEDPLEDRLKSAERARKAR